MATLFTKVTDPDALVFPAEEEIFLLQDAAEADTKALFRKLTDSPPPPFFLAAMDKPAGMRTDMSSGEAMREAVDRFLEDNGVGKNYLEWMPHPVGQLDLYTTGLLLFTNCGDLGHLLCLPDHVSKTYLVTLVVKKRAVENFVSEDDHEAGCSHDCINACENERVAFISESSFFTAGQLEALTVPRNKRRENKVFGAGGETETFTRETELDSVCFDSVEVILDGEHAPKEVLPGGKDHQGFMASYRRTAWDKKYEVKLLVKIRCGKNHVVKRLFQQRLGVPVRYLRRVAIDGLTVDEGGWVFCSAAFLLCSVLSALANYYLALLARHFECDKYGDLLQVVVEKAFAEKLWTAVAPGPGSYVPSRRVFIFGIAALAFPAATVERLTELKFLSSLSLFSMLFVVAAVFAEAAESASANAGEQLALLGEEAGGRAAEADGGAAAGGLAPAPSVGLLPSSFASGVQSFSVVFFSNVNQMCSVAITSSLAATTSSKGSKCKSTQHRRLRSVIFAAAFLVGLLYFAVASAVVVRNQRHTLPNFLANYDVDDALMVVARFLLTGVLLLSVTVDTYSARQAIARIVENWWFADQDYYHHHRVGGLDRQLRFRVVIVFLTLAFCASLACTITNVAEAISITSSLFASSVAMGVPAALVLLCPEVAEKEGLPLRRAGPALLLGLTLLLWGNVLAKIAAV
eukprot:g13760.t1